MRIVLFGPSGQVGWELMRSLAPLGELTVLHGDATRNTRGLAGDFSDPAAVAASITTLKPDWVVNAAAYTAVDRAESEPDRARCVNARAPGAIAVAAERVGARLVHYSTDYVFDGGGERPYLETDPTAPLGVYGQSKHDGEVAVLGAGAGHIVLRTSWVYGLHGANFLKTMLRLAGTRPTLGVVGDQIGAPTGAELIADVTSHALRGALDGGLYHLAAAGETTWYDYAALVIGLARERGVRLTLPEEGLRRITTAEYPTPAARPKNSRLDCGKLQRALRVRMPHWTVGVRRVVEDLLEVRT
jgi:dTDP-4-dehydrorhamnose reductase